MLHRTLIFHSNRREWINTKEISNRSNAVFVLTILGLCLFEVISSLDNAVINAQVLSTMSEKWRRRFLTWGIFFAVFLARGVLPALIVWAVTPQYGFWGSITATFSGNQEAAAAMKSAAPLLLCGGGVFLVLLFVHWLFCEPKNFGLPGERFFLRQASWFYLLSSASLAVIAWFAVTVNPWLAFSATVGSTAFFLSHGFKEHAEKVEKQLANRTSNRSDLSKFLYLEVIDLCFSIDGVIGAFGFTMNVTYILIGNGLGAIVVRELTRRNVDRIKDYPYLKNGAMYAIGMLGTVMLLESFHVHVPIWITPVSTMLIVGFFLWMCFWKKETETQEKGVIEIHS